MQVLPVFIFVFSLVWMSKSDQTKICTNHKCIIYYASSYFIITDKNTGISDVNFVDSVLTKFPNQMLDAYPELRKCDISDTMMKHLDIKRATKLEWLDVSKNQISELSEETFKNIRGIVSLYLSWNKITDIKPNLFDDLEKLEVLDLSHNQITFLDVDGFNNLPSLQSLYINHNNVTEFYINGSKADNLTTVYGGHNQINIGELELDNNRLSSLILKEKSRKVSVNSNQIESIEISPKGELEILFIRDNLLTDIRNITEIVSLQVLDISSNPIKSIEDHSFDKMTNLRHLSLRNTGLLIPKMFLPAQRKLTYLDISENRIRRLDLRSLKYLVNLETLKMDSCSMEIIENFKDQKEILPALNTITIDRNKFQCRFIVEFIIYCSKSEVKTMSDLLRVNIKSPNILGINCDGIEELNEEDKNKYQWQGYNPPKLLPDLSNSFPSSTVEPEKTNYQWEGFEQSKVALELKDNHFSPSIEKGSLPDSSMEEKGLNNWHISCIILLAVDILIIVIVVILWICGYRIIKPGTLKFNPDKEAPEKLI